VLANALVMAPIIRRLIDSNPRDMTEQDVAAIYRGIF
jgi:hypothetical protein